VGSRLPAVSYKMRRLQLLMRDLQLHAEDKLKHYIRMNTSTFDEMFSVVE